MAKNKTFIKSIFVSLKPFEIGLLYIVFTLIIL